MEAMAENEMMGLGENIDLNALSNEELQEVISENKDIQKRLQQEIDLLKKQINQFGIDLIPPKEHHIVYRPDGTSNVEEVKARLTDEIRKYSSRLEETIRLTDVVIHYVERKVAEIVDDHLCKKMFSVDLELLGRRMRLKYETEEELAEPDGDSSRGRIVWFEVNFEEEIHNAIGNEISKAAGKTAIHSVFSLLKTFLQWQQSRDKLVQHFQEKYPQNVQVHNNPEGLLVLTIGLQTPRQPVFEVEWGRKTVDVRIVPDLKLKVTAPEKLVALDSKKILEQAPEMFEHMLTTYGQEKALDTLINLCNRQIESNVKA